METLIIDYVSREKRYAYIKDDIVEKLAILQPAQESAVGNIYLGVVTRVLPGMNAAFVDIGAGQNGYLPADNIPPLQQEDGKTSSIRSLVHQGQRLLVQIEKDATRNKGPRLTGNIEFAGKFIVYMPKGNYTAVSKKIADRIVREKWLKFAEKVKNEEEGILFRTACEHAAEEDVFHELESLRTLYRKLLRDSLDLKKPGLLAERNSFLDAVLQEMLNMKEGIVACNDAGLTSYLRDVNKNERINIFFHHEKKNIFSFYGLNHELEKALKKIVWLRNGAYLVFDETEALTVIDVNTGKFSGKLNQRDTIVKTNEMAAEEIARQIRLRDLSGIILIDFIDMKDKEDEERILAKMKAALARDEKRTKIAGFTSLGILQLTRKRTNVSLLELLTVPCPVCGGSGRVLSPETVAFQLERELWEYKGTDAEAVWIESTEKVKEVFCGPENVHRRRLEEVLGFKIVFTLKESLHPFYNIRRLGNLADVVGAAKETGDFA